MGLVWQSTTTTDQGSSTLTSITVTKPASTVQNDALEAIIQCDNGAVLTAPSVNWTLRKKTVDGGNNVQISTYRLLAGAAEPASYQWTSTGGNIFEGAISRYTGPNVTTPDDAVVASTNGASTGLTLTATGITTTTDHDFDLAVMGTWSATLQPTFNGAGYAGDASFGSNGNFVQIQRKAISPAAGTGNQTWTQNVSGPWVAQQYALKPAASSTGVRRLGLEGGMQQLTGGICG